MEVYAEYAFAENFLIDAMLLYLTFRCMRIPARVLPVAVASSFGASFAVLYALFALPYALSLCIKIAAGGVMCLLANGVFTGGVRFLKLNKAQKLRRVRSFFSFTAVFFLLSACLCGVFYAVDATGKALKAWQIPVCVFFVFACEAGAKRIFKQQKIARLSRTCILYAGNDESANGVRINGVRVNGFIDSGNRAKAPDGAPICFLPPAVALSLMNETVRMQDFAVSTVAGKKIIKIFRGTILIYERGEAHKIKQAHFRKVYFSPSAHLSGNRALLPADFLNETQSGEESDGNGINGINAINDEKPDGNVEKPAERMIQEAAVSETAEADTKSKTKRKKITEKKDKAKAKQRGEKR